MEVTRKIREILKNFFNKYILCPKLTHSYGILTPGRLLDPVRITTPKILSIAC